MSRFTFNLLFLTIVFLLPSAPQAAFAVESTRSVAAIITANDDARIEALHLYGGRMTTLKVISFANSGKPYSLFSRLIQKTEQLQAPFAEQIPIATNIVHDDTVQRVHLFSFTPPMVERRIEARLEIWGDLERQSVLLSAIDVHLYPADLFEDIRRFSRTTTILVSPELPDVIQLFKQEGIKYLEFYDLPKIERKNTVALVTTNAARQIGKKASKDFATFIVLQEEMEKPMRIICSTHNLQRRLEIRLPELGRVVDDLQMQLLLADSLRFSLKNQTGEVSCN